MTDVDGRIRDLMIYHHSETGRFGARGAQILNLAKGDVEDMDSQCQDIIDLDVASLDFLYGDANHAIGDCVRGAIIPSPGHKLFVEDYSSIEARVLFWLAGEEKGLQQFRDKADLYVDMARVIFDNANITKRDNPKERQLGKQAVLGCGYGMGWRTFKKTCEKYGLDLTKLAKEYLGDYYPIFKADLDEWYPLYEEDKEEYLAGTWYEIDFKDKGKFFSTLQYFGIDPLADLDSDKIDLGDYFAKKVVKSYRTTYDSVVRFWYDCEKAARAAIVTQSTQRVGRVFFGYRPGVLLIKLPSGRVLYYWNPVIKYKEVSWKLKAKIIEDGEEWKLEKEQIHYNHVDSLTKRWSQTSIYSGKIVDHITQGTARDIMCNGMKNVSEDKTFKILFTPHDEAVTEAPEGTDQKKLGQLLCDLPPWAAGLPMESEGWEGYRYRK
jgi:DNA polymerase